MIWYVKLKRMSDSTPSQARQNKNHATEDRTSFMVSSLNTVLQEILVYRQEDTLLFFLHMQRHWVDYFLQACSVFRLETHVYHMANNYNLASHIQLFHLYSASKDSYIYSYRYICWTFHAALSPPFPPSDTMANLWWQRAAYQGTSSQTFQVQLRRGSLHKLSKTPSPSPLCLTVKLARQKK